MNSSRSSLAGSCTAPIRASKSSITTIRRPLADILFRKLNASPTEENLTRLLRPLYMALETAFENEARLIDALVRDAVNSTALLSLQNSLSRAVFPIPGAPDTVTSSSECDAKASSRIRVSSDLPMN